ncbi:hypothetical protein [Deferrisoma sp.]
MVVRGVWRTAEGKPFFANLKVMRAVLRRLEEALGPGGGVRAWVFLEDRFGFVAEGPETLPELLEGARRRAGEAFRAENREPLWAPGPVGEPVSPGDPDPTADLARWPAEAGLAETPEDYPWCGGEWLIR